jgi:hypothetical protein
LKDHGHIGCYRSKIVTMDGCDILGSASHIIQRVVQILLSWLNADHQIISYSHYSLCNRLFDGDCLEVDYNLVLPTEEYSPLEFK